MTDKPTEFFKLSKLKANPDNPRYIKGDRLEKLTTNILRYPKFLRERPMVHKQYIIYGGNMRLQVFNRIIKMEESVFNELVHSLLLDIEVIDLWREIRKNKGVPAEWVADASDYTESEIKAFIIIDNVDFGSHDWEKIANEWSSQQVEDWGLTIPDWTNDKNEAMLQMEGDTKQVNFTARDKPGASHSDYAVFEALLLNADQKELVTILDEVRNSQGYEKQGDALMHIVRYYKSKHV